MTIARIISIGVVVMFALAVGIATFDAVYAENPCCAIQNGVWIVLKTGKPASLAQIQTMQKSQPSASPKADTPKTGGTTGGSNSGGSMGHSGGGK
jgi:hypothetical protein